MGRENIIYDGSESGIASDSSTNPSYLPPIVDSESVNLIYRNGVRRTRPPFLELKIVVHEGEDESIIEEFRTGTFQGACAYRATKAGTHDGIICSVSGTIYFIKIVNGLGYLKVLMRGNDPGMMHTWFVQAEEWVYIQNGVQNPIAWDGDSSGKPTNLQAQGQNLTNSSASIILSTRSRTSGVATLVTSSSHNLEVGDYVEVSGVNVKGFNGTWKVKEVVNPTTFKYNNPGNNVNTWTDNRGRVKKHVGAIRLTWTNNDTMAKGIEIQRRSETKLYSTIAKVDANVSEFVDVNVKNDTLYYYRVRAFYEGELATPWSNEVSKKPSDTTITKKLPDSLFRLNPAKKEMPIGTIMVYAFGRVWVSDKNNNIYASDIIFGDGFTNTGNTRNFTEQTYWAEGGSFRPPSTLGNITGMAVMPALDYNDRGQGAIVVMCDNGAFTIDGSLPREKWQDAAIQKVALFGRGNVSPWSLTPTNNELFFRSNEGWSMFTTSQVDFQQRLAFRQFSKEVSKWVSKDTRWMRQFASAIFFDNRIICTVSPFTVSSTIEGAALHRPHRGMVVLDLDQSTASSPDASVSFRWNGIWTGPRPTQLVSANIRGEKRAFAFSFDKDGKNRIYEFLTDGTDDYVNGASKPIKSYFITKRYDFSNSERTSKFFKKKLVGGNVWISSVSQEVKISASYRPDNYPCWNQLLPEITFGRNTCKDEVCSLIFSQDKYREITFPTPDEVCLQGSNGTSIYGYEFQLLFEMEGDVTIDRLRIAALTVDEYADPTGDCLFTNTGTGQIDCCQVPDFDYYSIID